MALKKRRDLRTGKPFWTVQIKVGGEKIYERHESWAAARQREEDLIAQRERLQQRGVNQKLSQLLDHFIVTSLVERKGEIWSWATVRTAGSRCRWNKATRS